MSPFDEATALQPLGEGAYSWSVPDGWQQGRGAWGGLIVGALVRAVELTEPDPSRTLRTVSIQIVAPALVGAHRIQVQPVRRGSAMSTWTAALSDAQGAPVGAMVAVTGSPRTTDMDGHAAWGTSVAPAVPAADDLHAVPVGPPFPVFTQHCEFRAVTGLPMSSDRAEALGWVGYAQPTPMTSVALVALIDAWWPASLVILDAMARFATVNFAATLLVDPATVRPNLPLIFESYVSAAIDGFTSEHRRLWTADGRVAVDNLQTIVVGA